MVRAQQKQLTEENKGREMNERAERVDDVSKSNFPVFAVLRESDVGGHS